MGLSSLRRHRGDYVEPTVAPPPASRDELAEQLAAERAKVVALEAKFAEIGGTNVDEIRAAFDKVREGAEIAITEARQAADDAVERAKALEAELAALKAATPTATEPVPDGAQVEASADAPPAPPPVDAPPEDTQAPPRASRRR